MAPSDHLILDEVAFARHINLGFDYVSTHDSLLTLGIQPHRPDTGYGYIQYIKENPDNEIFKVKTFTEKPNLELAEQFLESGDFLWNAGIFIWNVKTIKEALGAFLPELDELFNKGHKALGTAKEKDFINTVYPVCENISIDYGIIEKAENVHVLPSEFGWSDLGTWKSLNDVISERTDENQNVAINTQAMFENSSGCMVVSENNKLVVLQGVSDIYVINTEDALLVCNKDQEQEVKNIVNELKKKFNSTYN